MKGKRNILAAGLILALSASVWGCQSREKGAGEENVPEFVLTYAENQAEDYPTTQGAYRFAELVKQRTGGKVEILINAEGILGDERTVIEQLQFGGVDFARVSLSPLSEFVPELNVLQLPYLYTGAEHMWKVLEGEIGDSFLGSFEGSSLVALSWYDAGARNFYNSVRPIEKLEDMKGLTIRVQESELMSDSIRVLGAVPARWLIEALFCLRSWETILSWKITGPLMSPQGNTRQLADYTTYEHTRVPELQLAAQSTWDKLPEEYRIIITQCAKESARYERSLWKEREAQSEQNIREAGCIITELSKEEKSRFQAAVMPMYGKYCSDYVDMIDRIVAEGR